MSVFGLIFMVKIHKKISQILRIIYEKIVAKCLHKSYNDYNLVNGRKNMIGKENQTCRNGIGSFDTSFWTDINVCLFVE